MVSLQVYLLNLRVDQQDIIDVNNQHLYFSNHEEWYFIAIICTWLFNNVHKGFKDHAYTNNLDSMINNFYHWLFAHQINFVQPGQGPRPSISDLFNVLLQKVSTSPPPCLLFYETLTLPLHLFLHLLKIQAEADKGGDAKEACT